MNSRDIDLPPISNEAAEVISNLMKKLEISAMVEVGEAEAQVAAIHSAISVDLAIRMNAMSKHLPKESKISVLSLGCGGFAHEYIALRGLLGPNVKIEFIGVDIHNKKIDAARKVFQHVPEARFVASDATNKEELYQKLKSENLLPALGFDFIILRHPEIASLAGKKIFTKIITTTMPFFSAREAKCFISCYFPVEFSTLKTLLVDPYYYGLPGNLIMSTGGTKIIHDSGKATIDGYAVMMGCDGLAYQNTPLIENSLLTRDLEPKQIVLEKIKLFCGNETKFAKILAAIEQKNYNLALRHAANECALPVVVILLQYKSSLNINVNEPSKSTGLTALDWLAKNTEAPQVVRDKIREELIKNGAVPSIKLQAKTIGSG